MCSDFLKDYNFDLPKDLIAVSQVVPRDASKLLVYKNRNIEDTIFRNISTMIPVNSVFVINDTKVMKARIKFNNNGRKSEVFFVDKVDSFSFTALVSPGKIYKVGTRHILPGGIEIEIIKVNEDGSRVIKVLDEGLELHSYLDEYGLVPLPPYMNIEDPNSYEAQYQTVYAERYGSVAAPTAGLHFTPELIAKLKAEGVEFVNVTLDVGIGTFMPVRVDKISDHKMHSENFSISKETAYKLNKFKDESRLIISVGTTSFRVLHSMYDHENNSFKSGNGSTDIFIYPGYKDFVVDAILTNFHLPESTLFMLISALVGIDEAKRMYNHAVTKRYRFYSFGDSSLIYLNK
jgi:S-adenosylmethionine:tRNA ribosyltransferase-isomerase